MAHVPEKVATSFRISEPGSELGLAGVWSVEDF
jgi:hypothetical protein